MLYAAIKSSDRELISKQASFGESLELNLESKGFQTELSTNADWGYVFSLKTNSIPVDISVVNLFESSIGIAVEPAKNLLGFQLDKKRIEAIEFVKNALNEILRTEDREIIITWYTDFEWREKFGDSFWNAGD